MHTHQLAALHYRHFLIIHIQSVLSRSLVAPVSICNLVNRMSRVLVGVKRVVDYAVKVRAISLERFKDRPITQSISDPSQTGQERRGHGGGEAQHEPLR